MMMRRWRLRKEHKPRDSAVGMATGMGVELLTEQEYFASPEAGRIRYQAIELDKDAG
jgi:hypothetical protein